MHQAYSRKKEALAARLRDGQGGGAGAVALQKETSNLFRDRAGAPRARLDVRGFNEVLSVGKDFVEAEGMVTYEALVEACLRHGVMPAVVPQLKTIPLGGAVAGVGIESSSHRHGLVHDTMLEIEVLLGDGRILTCTPDNEHADLFFGFPNSYGTLGYALRVKAKTVPVKPFVRLEHLALDSPEAFFSELKARLEAGKADFIDGTVFNPGQFFITLG